MIDLLKYWLFTLMIGSVTFMLAYFVAKMSSGHSAGVRGRLPSWKFKIRNYRIHLHHWFVSAIVGLIIMINYASFSFYQFVILFGGSLGITVHGIKNYHDWKHIIVKE